MEGNQGQNSKLYCLNAICYMIFIFPILNMLYDIIFSIFNMLYAMLFGICYILTISDGWFSSDGGVQNSLPVPQKILLLPATLV